MMNIFLLYFTAVFIWGTTWLAISFQLGDVAPEVSLAYRFGIAAILLFAYCLIRKLNLRFNLSEHLRFLGLALTMFGFNFYLLYSGQAFLNSAFAAIAFATLIVMNIINSKVIFGTKISQKEYLGAALGLLGIGTLFWPQLNAQEFNNEAVYGLILCLTGTFVASLGSMLSESNKKTNLPIIQINAFSMGYGATIMAVLALINGNSFIIDVPQSYWLSMGYLSVFGSVIVFGCYLTLIGKIGASKTAYITIITPAIAVVLSSLFEDFVWTYYTITGISLILVGNVIVLRKEKPKKSLDNNELQPEAA